MHTEKIVLNEKRNVTLAAYIQDVGGQFYNITKRPAIMILPGGGYQTVSDREGEQVAFPFLQTGYQVFVLRYSVGNTVHWPEPLDDYEQAMEFIRGNAEKWMLYPDKIAVIGFSAGGHLAACAATMGKNRPNAAILGYAVTEKDTAEELMKDVPDTVSRIDGKTCPCFVFATRTDNVVPVGNSIHFLEGLLNQGIMFEAHIYAYGTHGFSTADSSVLIPGMPVCERAAGWVKDCIGWLKEVFGDFAQEGLSAPKLAEKENGDREEYLSLDCTFGHLMKNEQARLILQPLLEAQKKGQEADRGVSEKLIARMKLSEMLQMGNVPQVVLDELAAHLGKIKNI